MQSTLARTTTRITVAAAAAALVLPAILPSPASAATQAPPGIFGTSDPTYDGVFRQSIALVGLRAAQTPIPPSAVGWLVGQQCASGVPLGGFLQVLDFCKIHAVQNDFG